MTDASKKKIVTVDFEKAYAELEAIVRELESGELTLDASVKKFERGLALAKALKAKLAEVEHTVEEMKASVADAPED